ncbi:hypothetical protein [Lacipirellula limnantheis]|uniref:Uncharacterized protein n=1 Tax=Lacipirellula limnantheis TaxID=2528024 RepID=A0A517U1N3_9BACT|nr:hypothetical protein [Lacipirellula limnantheis]QDT74549.1 hypothetical protein I41_37460 [Lacipirellula limnantheis]
MTAQVPDIVNFRGQQYALAGIDGVGLFKPEDHGLVAQAFSTACWRGFHCEYSVHDEALFLEQLNIGLSEEDSAKGAQVFGRVLESYTYDARKLEKGAWVPVTQLAHDKRVRNLHQPVRFSGGLLLGGEFIREMYVHMGFHPAHKFRIVHELIFEEGRLQKAFYCSTEMANFREAMASRPGQPERRPSKQEIEEWVQRTFSLDYERGDA